MTMIKGSEKIITVKVKEFFVIQIFRLGHVGNIEKLGFFHDRGRVVEFSDYSQANTKINSFMGDHPKNYIYSINKYFKLCSD